jgi:hypothetical protein
MEYEMRESVRVQKHNMDCACETQWKEMILGPRKVYTPRCWTPNYTKARYKFWLKGRYEALGVDWRS